jgi:hypothetical protein
LGINARDDLVGVWDSGVTSLIGHGFVCPRGRQCFRFDVPVAGATVTQADDINAHGEIVGVYFDVNGLIHAFLVFGGNFTSFDFPGATDTLAWASTPLVRSSAVTIWPMDPFTVLWPRPPGRENHSKPQCLTA